MQIFCYICMMSSKLIYGIPINIPKKPSKRFILGYNKSKKKQKWERTELPDNWEILPESKKAKFISQEYTRREEGVWFMNNGVATYITGTHRYRVSRLLG